MWANIRQSDSRHSIDCRDDPSQEVRAFPQNYLHNAQTSNFILCHLLVSFANSFEGPLRRPSFLPVSFFEVLPTTIPHCKVATTHHLGSTVCSLTSFALFQNLSERGFLLPLNLYPCLYFPRSVRWDLSCLCPFKSKILSHSAAEIVRFPSPSKSFHVAPSSPLPLSIAITSVAVCPAALSFHGSTADTN